MQKRTKSGLSVGVVICLTALGLLFSWSTRDTSAQSSCVGKPYPSPGCPILRSQPTASAAALCGNGRLDGSEECDEGAANGQPTGDCSSNCHLRYCGDGTTQAGLGEQCEPPAQEYYGASDSGTLVIERRFTADACGPNYCTQPQCDNAGTCTGGCKVENLPACVPSSSSVSNAAASSASVTSPLPASSSSVSSVELAGRAPAASSVASSEAGASSVSLSASAQSSSTSQRSSAQVSSAADKPTGGLATVGIGLSIAIDGPLVFQRTQQAVFRISIRNNSALTAQNVIVSDYLINYGSFDSFTLDANTGGTGSCVLTGISVRCSGFDLAPGELKTVRLTFLFLQDSSCQSQKKIEAYASVTSDLPDPDLRDNETDLFSSVMNCGLPVRAPIPTSSSSSKSSVSASGAIAAVSSSSASGHSSVSGEATSAASSGPVAVCGNGTQEGSEECDFGTQNGTPGAVCNSTCHRSLPGPAAPAQDSYETMRVLLIRISYGVLAALVPVYLFVTRKKWLRLFKDVEEDDLPVPHGKSIDDVPLDEIEMPWRKL